MIGRIAVTPRARPSMPVRIGVPLLSLLAALVLGAVILAATGADPVEVYRTMFDAGLNGARPIERTLTYATPLILTGLAAAVAFRMKAYNIGAEASCSWGRWSPARWR